MQPGLWLAQIRQDLSYGLRKLWKSPGFTIVTILTLALGIGANTAMFSVVNSVLLRPLPYKDPGRIVIVWEKPPKGRQNSVSAANFLDWREQNRVFEHLVAISMGGSNLSGKDVPERVDSVRTALLRLDRDMPVTAVQTMDEVMINSMSQSRVQTWFFGCFGLVALALASLGIYGVMSYSVAQSTHDMGLRLALGARERDVLKLVLSQGMLLTGTGLVIGIGGSLALTRLLASLLFGVKPTDPWTFVAVTVLLALVAFAAGYIPAKRATQIDPLVALRLE